MENKQGQNGGKRSFMTAAELKSYIEKARPYFEEAQQIAGIADDATRRAKADDFKKRFRLVRSELVKAGAWYQIEPKVLLGIITTDKDDKPLVSKDQAYMVLLPDNVEVAMVMKESCDLTGVPKPTEERELFRPRKEGQINEFARKLIAALEKRQSETRAATATSLVGILDSIDRTREGYLIHILRGWSQKKGRFSTDANERKAAYERRRRNRQSMSPDAATTAGASEATEREKLETQIAALEAEADELVKQRKFADAGKKQEEAEVLQAQLDAMPDDEDDDLDENDLEAQIAALEAEADELVKQRKFADAGKKQEEAEVLRAQLKSRPSEDEKLKDQIAALEAEADELVKQRKFADAGKKQEEAEVLRAQLSKSAPGTSTDEATAHNGANGSLISSVLNKYGAVASDEDRNVLVDFVTKAQSGDKTAKAAVDSYLAGKMKNENLLKRAKTVRSSRGAAAAQSASAPA